MPDSERKVLVISNLFHSSPRIPRILKRLPSLGWSPTVITPKMDAGMENAFNAPPKDLEKLGIRVVEAGQGHRYEGIKEEGSDSVYRGFGRKVADRMDGGGEGRTNRMLDKYYWRLYLTLHFPDVEKRWKADAIKAAEALLESERFDLVLSSSSPIITHIICSEIKKKHGLPWIAEYRDLWTLNYNYQLGRVMRFFDRRLERKTVGSADALVTVTDVLADELRAMFPGKEVRGIPTGFDKDESPATPPLTKEFTITYTGQYYRDKQDPMKILRAIGELISEGKIDRSRVRIRFFGPVDNALNEYAARNGIGEVFAQYGVVSRNEALLKQKESQILLYMNWEDPEQRGVLPLKLIEYFQAGRPILLTGGAADNLMAKTIIGTGAGRVAVSNDDIKAAVQEHYHEYVQRGAVSFNGIAGEIEKFDAKHSAESYARLMAFVADKKAR
jgi:hypothetical protein